MPVIHGAQLVAAHLGVPYPDDNSLALSDGESAPASLSLRALSDKSPHDEPIASSHQILLDTTAAAAAAMEKPAATVQPSLPLNPDEEMPTMEPTAETIANFIRTGAPSIPNVLQGGVLAPDGILKWAHKVMECNRAGKLNVSFVASADDCLTACENVKTCTHVNVEEYPSSAETKKKFLFRTFSSGSQIVDQSWEYVLHDPVMGQKVPDPVSERDDEINCYMRATADEQQAARELFKEYPPPAAYYSLELAPHMAQYVGMGTIALLSLIGAVFVVLRNRGSPAEPAK